MPILSFSLFRNRLFTASMFSLFFITSTQSAISFLMPFYLQDVLRFSPTQMGWIIDRQLRGHRLGGADRRLVVGSHGFAPALHRRIGNHRHRPIFYRLIADRCIDLAHHRAAALDRLGLGDFQFAQPERDLGLGAARRSRHRVGNEHDHGAHRRRDGRRAFGNFVYLWARRGGLSRAQIESPQSWGAAPEIFVHSFNHTVHVVNFFTILSVFFSAVRGPRREIRQR